MIYFDSAATTLQKPPMVARAMARATAHKATPRPGAEWPPPPAARHQMA